MKYILSFVGIVIVVLAVFLCRGESSVEAVNEDYMRIHIVANSNSEKDQNVKYVVKDAVVEFLIPVLAEAETKDEAKTIILENINKINEVVLAALRCEGAAYSATVSISEENMPMRVYDNLILEEGVYECLNISLGQAQGDNWWCVVFPAVCFLDTKNPANFVYISKIWEILNSV
ncbi:MAG: stage II sporulation protein R [Clostridia bacterium]|nr:stage II sporulation protein R [Clostridia bacterium]